MLLFNALSGGSFSLSGAEKDIVVFPPEGAKAASDSAIVLLAAPEEKTTKGCISWPGEYNVAGVSIKGVGHVEGQQVSYVVEADGVRMGFLSTPLQDWSDKQIELAPDIDVLAIPTEDAKLVQKLVDEFDPRIILLLPGKDAAAVQKAIGVKEHVQEYKLKGSLPVEGREVYVLGA